MPFKTLNPLGSNKSCLMKDTINEKDMVSSSDDEETCDALMSLYLPSQIPASEENEMPSKDRHQKMETLIEAPTDSMLAFKLSTPPKEARLDFLNVTSSY